MSSKNSVTEYLEQLLARGGIRDAVSDAHRLAADGQGLLNLMQKDAYNLENSCQCSSSAAELLRLTAALTSRRITDRYKAGKRYTDEQIREYAVGLLFGEANETVVAILFDKSGRLISTEYVSDGIVSSAGFLPRKLLDIMTRYSAYSTVLAHNHPCGTVKPSKSDIAATSNAISVLGNAEKKLIAHYVVSGFDVCDCMKYTSEVDTGFDSE